MTKIKLQVFIDSRARENFFFNLERRVSFSRQQRDMKVFPRLVRRKLYQTKKYLLTSEEVRVALKYLVGDKKIQRLKLFFLNIGTI